MSSNIKNYVNNLKDKENAPQYLPAYLKENMVLHHRYARIHLMMEYYMFYEMIAEEINPCIDSARDTAEAFHGLVRRFLDGNFHEEAANIAQELLSLRSQVIDKMQVLTSHVDCFAIYEYIFNRAEYRFEDMKRQMDDATFARVLTSFIFSYDDNMRMNENIRFAVSQLPMRMTRKRYYDIIRDSISLFQGSNVDSLEGFLYMFRTNAMLYRDENQEKYFTEFADMRDQLSLLDFDYLSEEMYNIYSEKIYDNIDNLNDISDLYFQLGEMINDLYTLCVTQPYVEEESYMVETDRVIRGINALFLEQDSAVWQQAGDVSTESEEDKLNWLEKQFVAVEGKQEHLFAELQIGDGAVQNILESFGEEIASKGLSEAFESLRRLSLLVSNSVFADLEQKESEEKVTKEMADRVAAELIEECRSFFEGKSRALRRAVMANTLEKMPVFFHSAQEVADYITDSLSSCDDEAEKYAAKELLLDVIE